MAESRALSQWEIDALLNQIPEGGPAPGAEDEAAAAPSSVIRDRGLSRVIKGYDFRRPDKFSKEQWHTLQTMHDAFARLIGVQFSSRLRTLVSVRLSSIDQGLYEEWQAQLPSQTTCYVLSVPPLDGNIVVEFNHDVASEVIDRLLGGAAVMPVQPHDLSDIELAVLRGFGRPIAVGVREMWANLQPVEPELQDLGMDANLIQIAHASDVVVTAFFEVSLGARLGAMSVCTPYTVLEQVASRLSAQVWLAAGQQTRSDDGTRRQMRALLGTASLELAVELGAAEVPARAVAELKLGDTICLDARVDRPLPVLIGGERRFDARPGMLGNRVAVRVSDVAPQPGARFAADTAADTAAHGAADPMGAPAAAEPSPSNVTPLRAQEVTGAA